MLQTNEQTNKLGQKRKSGKYVPIVEKLSELANRSKIKSAQSPTMPSERLLRPASNITSQAKNPKVSDQFNIKDKHCVTSHDTFNRSNNFYTHVRTSQYVKRNPILHESLSPRTTVTPANKKPVYQRPKK